MMQERQYKILKLLYRSDGFVTVERLAADVNCSLKTIRNDLKQLGSFLEEYGLGKVVSKSNKGVCLIKDKDWDTAKQAWNDVNQMELYGTDKHFQILELLLKQRSIQKMKLEKRLLISRLDAEKATSQASVWLTAHHVAGVTGAIAGLEKKFGIHYSFDGYQQLSFLLSLCVIRIRKKEYAEIPADFGHQRAEWQGLEYDLSMAETCMESLKEYYHTDFPEGEKQFTVHYRQYSGTGA